MAYANANPLVLFDAGVMGGQKIFKYLDADVIAHIEVERAALAVDRRADARNAYPVVGDFLDHDPVRGVARVTRVDRAIGVGSSS